MTVKLDPIWSKPAETTPAVSVVMPVRNSEATVAAAVASVLAQRGCVVEVVISDDCSADGTLGAVLDATRAYSGPHAVSVWRTSRRLAIDHFPTLAETATGRLLVQAHGDDVSLPDRIARLAALHQETGAALLTSSVMWRGADGTIPEPLPPDYAPGWLPLQPILANAAVSVLWGARYAVDRRVLTSFPRLDSSYLAIGHDVLQAFRASLVGGVWFTAERLVECGRHDGQWSRRLWDRRSPDMDRFGFCLHRMGIFRAMFRDLAHAKASGLVTAERHGEIQGMLKGMMDKLIDMMITARDNLRRQDMDLLWVPSAELAAADRGPSGKVGPQR